VRVTPGRIVSLLELLKAYAEIFADCSYWLASELPAAYERRLDESSAGIILDRLGIFKDECERLNLQMTLSLIKDAIPYAEGWKDGGAALLHDAIHNVCDLFTRELSQQLFMRINAAGRTFCDDPSKNWQMVIKRFGRSLEMSKK